MKEIDFGPYKPGYRYVYESNPPSTFPRFEFMGQGDWTALDWNGPLVAPRAAAVKEAQTNYFAHLNSCVQCFTKPNIYGIHRVYHCPEGAAHCQQLRTAFRVGGR